MPNYTKYQAYKKQRRAVGTSTWEDVVPLTLSIDGDGTMPPIVLENPSEDCGYVPSVEPMYKWVDLDPSVDWICDDEPESIEKWVQTDETICDEPRAFENNFKLKAYFEGENEQVIDCCEGTYQSGECVGKGVLTSIPSRLSGMTSCIIGDCVSTIAINCFYGDYTKQLRSIQFDSTMLHSFESGAFEKCVSLSSITIPNSVVNIGMAAFHGCSSLTEVDLSNLNENVIELSDLMFAECTSITSITLPSHIVSLGLLKNILPCYNHDELIDYLEMSSEASVFSKCRNLSDVNLNEGLEYIGGWTFEGCYSLSSITIPSTVKFIGHAAFANCSALTSMTILATEPPVNDLHHWGGDLFDVDSIPDAIYVPSVSVNAYKSAPMWSNHADIIQPITT